MTILLFFNHYDHIRYISNLVDNNCSLVFNSTIWPLLQDCWVYRLELYTYLGWGGPSWENGTIVLPKGILHTQGWFLTLYVCVVVWCCSCCLPSWWSLSLLWLFFVICGGNSPLLGFLASFWSFGHLTVLQKNEKTLCKNIGMSGIGGYELQC